ncbi:acyltransferase family protein [uncultured Sphaerotilus sp.]|uniref:acyltransferase family protein n=1 Tax=uncultured Sphaerotilus sp. TaxID=474984 RepID=UPI0030CA3D06
MRPTPPSHRPDLDGLRAIAVLLVVVHHAEPGWLPGGYLGVDLFFVLSGYLISQIIWRSLDEGNFSLPAFYRRRIQRIFPALLLVIATTLGLGAWLLWPGEYRALGEQAAAAAVFLLNFDLARATGYFDTAAQLKPLLHLWSLSIEEQFYLVWPLLLLGLHRLRMRVLPVVAGLTLISLAAMLVSARLDMAATFFLPQARAWELLAGAWAAAMPQHYRRGGAVQAALGLAFLAGSAAWIGPQRASSVVLLMPVLGTMALLLAAPDNLVSRHLLANPPMVGLGLISYPFYLWHWPLLSLATVAASGPPTPAMRGALVLASLLLAALTWTLLERRIRPTRSVAVPWILVGLMATTGLCGLLIVRQDGLPARTTALNPLIAQFDWDVPRWTWSASAVLCQSRSPTVRGVQTYCNQNLPTPPEVALLGDSHALQLYPGLSERATTTGQSLLLLGASACAPFLGLDIRWAVDTKACSVVIDDALDHVMQSSSIHTVILAHRGPFYVSGLPTDFELAREPQTRVRLVLDHGVPAADNLTAYRQAMTATLTALQRAGKRVILVIDSPEMAMEPRACVRQQPAPANCGLLVSVYRNRAQRYLQVTAEVLRQFPAIEVWDLPRLLCDDRLCPARRGDDVLYRDPDHLSVRGSQWLAARFDPQPAASWVPAGVDPLIGNSGSSVTTR